MIPDQSPKSFPSATNQPENRGRSLLDFFHSNKSIIAIGIIGTLILLVAGLSPVSGASTDPHFGLIVSQSIIENQTIKLDAFESRAPEQFERYSAIGVGQIGKVDGHYYYRYPLGTPVFSIPAVWVVTELLGGDMLNVEHNHKTQNALSAVIVVAVFVLIYQLGRCYLDLLPSLIIATVSTMGSALISTLGSALWSMDLTVLFQLTVLLLIIRYERNKASTMHPFVLGFLLFAAFFVRPTAFLFILIIFAYLLLKHRQDFIKVAALSFLFLVALLLFNWLEFGSPLPAYYNATAWLRPSTVGVALKGLFISPSRGLLIYSPFFLLVFAGVLWYLRDLKTSLLYWLCVIWFVLHVAMIASTVNWWGGYSFGPRLLTDVLPALTILTILLWHHVSQSDSGRLKNFVIVSYLVLGGLGIAVNSYAGLFNEQVILWNGALLPDIDQNPEFAFNWQFPQFLASKELLCDRNDYFMRQVITYDPTLRPYSWGSAINADSDQKIKFQTKEGAAMKGGAEEQNISPSASELPAGFIPGYAHFLPTLITPGNTALFIGWSRSGGDVRWTECATSTIVIRLEQSSLEASYQLDILAGSEKGQEADVLVNGNFVGRLSFPGSPWDPTYERLLFNGSLLRAGELNEIAFKLPDGALAVPEENEHLQMAIHELRIFPAGDSPSQPAGPTPNSPPPPYP